MSERIKTPEELAAAKKLACSPGNRLITPEPLASLSERARDRAVDARDGLWDLDAEREARKQASEKRAARRADKRREILDSL